MSIQKILCKVPRILWVLVPLALILWGAANLMVTRQAAPAGKPTSQYTEATSSSEASADQSDVVARPISQPSSSQPQIQIPPQDVVSAVVVPSQVFSTPLIAFGAENKEEKSPKADPDLRRLMDEYVKLGGPDNIASAEAVGDYLANHPDSPCAVSLWQEKSGIEWRHGFFTDSITSLDAAWQRGKKATALDEKRLTEDGLSALLPKLAGAGNDIFQLGFASGRFYDHGNAANAGRGDYALITDFTVGQDKLLLDGAAKDYFFGASGVPGVAGASLFHDSNAKLDATDELIAAVRSGNATGLTATNTVNTAQFV